MTLFYPYALAGGLLIGLAVAVLWLGLGKIAGISGLLSQLSWRASSLWRWAFILGMAVACWLALYWGKGPPTLNPEHRPISWFIAAGLLVGFGAKLGSGCTSGHAICGLGRLSKRSLVATLCFMSCAALTVYVLRSLA